MSVPPAAVGPTADRIAGAKAIPHRAGRDRGRSGCPSNRRERRGSRAYTWFRTPARRRRERTSAGRGHLDSSRYRRTGRVAGCDVVRVHSGRSAARGLDTAIPPTILSRGPLRTTQRANESRADRMGRGSARGHRDHRRRRAAQPESQGAAARSERGAAHRGPATSDHAAAASRRRHHLLEHAEQGRQSQWTRSGRKQRRQLSGSGRGRGGVCRRRFGPCRTLRPSPCVAASLCSDCTKFVNWIDFGRLSCHGGNHDNI